MNQAGDNLSRNCLGRARGSWEALTANGQVIFLYQQKSKKMNLSAVQQKFILHWGEMGTRWGINRTVAQIHALLYVSPQPLPAEDIADLLSVARSNVSTSLKELQSWRIVKLVHVLGDKRDHFETMADVWEMFRLVLDERKRREIDPTLAMLNECVSEAEKGSDKHTENRLRELQKFFATTTAWYGQLAKWPTAALTKFISMGEKALKMVGG
jgi:DNA-binding transcriptional regulator GbsR (MarR family)